MAFARFFMLWGFSVASPAATEAATTEWTIMSRETTRCTSRVVAVVFTIGLGGSLASCGGGAPASQSQPSAARLPGPSMLCPPVGEVEYYMNLPTAAATESRPSVEGRTSSLECEFGDPSRSPQRAVVITYQLFPPKSARRPPGVAVRRIRNVGDWAVGFRRGRIDYVVVDEGHLDITVAADSDASALLGLAEEELARAPIADRS